MREPRAVSTTGAAELPRNWTARIALIVAVFALLVSAWAATSASKTARASENGDRRDDERILADTTAIAAKLDASALDRAIRKFVSNHSDALAQVAAADEKSEAARRSAHRLGVELSAEIQPRFADVVVRCRELLQRMNQAGRASEGVALASSRAQVRQVVTNFVGQSLISCLVATETNTTRLGWFLGRYFFGAPDENALVVLHFLDDYAGFSTLAQRIGVMVPARYSPPTPSGELRLTRAEMSGCDGLISQIAAYGSGNLVSGRITYHIDPSWRPTEGAVTRIPCLNFRSSDGLDQLQMGATTDGSAFALIRTRFAEPFEVEIARDAIDWSRGLTFELSWDFQRIDLDEAVRLTVNGASAFASPTTQPPEL
ncbi:MAG: hypothetical protein ABTQ32_04465 [Myxococcaceae bacterium]